VKQVVLVGLMGSGKSTVGALVAARTGRVFVDVDIVIAEETGKTVRELWEEGGETAYRSLESDAVLRVLASDTPSALAGSVVVWLRTRPTTLAGRVHAGDHRPLLGDNPAETLAAMADERSELYRKVATATIDTDGLTPDAIADVMVRLLASQRADD
jgi:shikimate kinase